jgi:5-methylcytosine-specific restriction endonuclease McrA
MKRIIILLSIAILIIANSFSQITYKIGKTEYYYNQYYSTTGKPMVKRSEANKNEFLKNKGYKRHPDGYEVDHIIPLSEGGTDDPSNMQLLTKEQHSFKTANERSANSNSTFSNYPNYNSNSTYKFSTN